MASSIVHSLPAEPSNKQHCHLEKLEGGWLSAGGGGVGILILPEEENATHEK